MSTSCASAGDETVANGEASTTVMAGVGAAASSDAAACDDVVTINHPRRSASASSEDVDELGSELLSVTTV